MWRPEVGARTRGGRKRGRGAAERVEARDRRIPNCRTAALHKLSSRLVNEHDLIVHEALTVSNLVRRPKPKPDPAGGYAPNGAAAKTALNRCIHDAGWGQLLAMITYKSESAGRTVIAVDT